MKGNKYNDITLTNRNENKWDLIKLVNFCTAKETLDKTKDNLQNRRKYLQTIRSTSA